MSVDKINQLLGQISDNEKAQLERKADNERLATEREELQGRLDEVNASVNRNLSLDDQAQAQRKDRIIAVGQELKAHRDKYGKGWKRSWQKHGIACGYRHACNLIVCSDYPDCHDWNIKKWIASAYDRKHAEEVQPSCTSSEPTISSILKEFADKVGLCNWMLPELQEFAAAKGITNTDSLNRVRRDLNDVGELPSECVSRSNSVYRFLPANHTAFG
ncbi:MAG: hypothetical protein ACE361_19445 [Aureliella sp.]